MTGHVPPSPGNYFPECVSTPGNIVYESIFIIILVRSMFVMWNYPFGSKKQYLATYLG